MDPDLIRPGLAGYSIPRYPAGSLESARRDIASSVSSSFSSKNPLCFPSLTQMALPSNKPTFTSVLPEDSPAVLANPPPSSLNPPDSIDEMLNVG
ncbi:hypothetical protein Q3G72_022800 [Acer saccharum]|nr:hypothetical protein Q3G72_022800 [Acer saccharum]